jgi:hypothetical protein
LPIGVIRRTGENYSGIRRKADPIDKKHSPLGADVDVTITSSFCTAAARTVSVISSFPSFP